MSCPKVTTSCSSKTMRIMSTGTSNFDPVRYHSLIRPLRQKIPISFVRIMNLMSKVDQWIPKKALYTFLYPRVIPALSHSKFLPLMLLYRALMDSIHGCYLGKNTANEL